MPARTAATVGDRIIELEFLCRCRLRRRRRGRRRQESFASATAVDIDATSGGVVVVGEEAQRGDGRAIDDDREEADEEQEQEKDGDDMERLDAEPEASARVRLISVAGELLGEAWAELAGAPDDWARYPLYSPGAVGIDNRTGSGGRGGGRAGSGEAPATQPANTNRPTGLDRGGVIPAPPATVRRRWGWRYRRDGSATSRRWFRPPPPPRDVAGEVRLRLGWVPSGLAVTVHRCRAAGGTAATGTGFPDGDTIRSFAGVGRRRPSIVVRAEPGGGAARAHPAEVDMDGNVVEEDARVASEHGGVQKSATVSKPLDGQPPSHQEVVPVGGPGATEATDNSSENFFFVLDTSCLFGGWNGEDVGGDDGGDIGSGDGARLVLSMTADDITLKGGKSTAVGGASDSAEKGATSSSASIASAELLLFPGAESARRWVRLTDTVGDTLGEVDVTIAWAVAPPLPPLLSPTRRSSSGIAAIESQDQQEVAPVMTDTTAVTRTASPGSSLEALLAPDEETRGNGGDNMSGDAGAAETDGNAEGGGARAEVEAEAGASGDGDGGVETFPEPAQVVSRCFSVHASDLVFRVSDLDVAVLVTMAKGIVRVSWVFFIFKMWCYAWLVVAVFVIVHHDYPRHIAFQLISSHVFVGRRVLVSVCIFSSSLV